MSQLLYVLVTGTYRLRCIAGTVPAISITLDIDTWQMSYSTCDGDTNPQLAVAFVTHGIWNLPVSMCKAQN